MHRMLGELSPSKLSIRTSALSTGIEITPAFKEILNQATNGLDTQKRRIFMAKTVDHMGKGGQRKAEQKECNPSSAHVSH